MLMILFQKTIKVKIVINKIVFLIQGLLKMSEGEPRNLRAKKAPAYLNSDEQDIDVALRMRAPNKKDAKQSTMQVNVLAKLLVKFINQTNHYYRDSLKDVRKQKKDKDKKPEVMVSKVPPKQQALTDIKQKLITVQKQDHPEESMKKQKNFIYSYKSSSLPTNDQKIISNSDLMKKIPRQIQPNPSVNHHQLINVLQNHPQLNQHLNDIQAIYPGIIQYLSENRKLLPTYVNNSKQQALTPQQLAIKERFLKTNQKPTQDFKTLPKPRQQQAKLFKRSSYHVAIAYHIYIRTQANNSNGTNQIDLDPTSHARRLRQQKAKVTEQQLKNSQK